MAPTTRHARWLLAALLGAIFLGNVDVAVVNIAAPAIHDRLHASGAELTLVVSGYMMAYATLLITGARLGDVHGYRRMFLLGLGAFTVASLACGLAPSAIALVVARILQGAAAAFMVSQVLTGVQLNFEGAERARAIGRYTLVLAISAVVGQALGGLLVAANLLGTSWRPIFLVNVPIGAALIVVAAHFLPPDRERRPRRLDLAGVSWLSIALLLLVVPLVLGPDLGWPTWVWVCLAASAAAAAVFVAVERGLTAHGGEPLVDLRLVTRPAIAWGLAAQAAVSGTYFAVLFVLALYLQRGLGESPTYSGLALVPWVAAFGVAGPVLGRLPAGIRRLGAPVGSLMLAAAYAAIAAGLVANVTAGAPLIALLGLGGLSFGFQFTGMVGHLTDSVSRRHAADMSGLFNTVMRIGSVIGVALFGTAYLALAPGPGRQAAIHGFTVVTIAFAATALLAAVAAHLSTRTAPAPAELAEEPAA